MYVVHVPDFPVEILEPWIAIENSGYGGPHLFGPYWGRPLGFGGASSETLRALQTLERDVLANGFRNPVCVWEVGGKFYLRYGGARVHVWKALAHVQGGHTPLAALVSGPHVPPLQLGRTSRSHPLDLHSSEGLPKQLFSELPWEWSITQTGHLDFRKCWGEFDKRLTEDPNDPRHGPRPV